jgi:N-acetylmuramoyl-L-alanine amidase
VGDTGGYFMDKTLLKKAAMQSVALMVAVVTLSYALQHYQAVTIAASNMVKEDALGNTTALADTIEPTDKLLTAQQNSTSLTIKPIVTLEELINRVDEGIMNQLSDNYLVIQKPREKDVTFQLEDLYINNSIRLTLTGVTKNTITSSMIARVRGSEIFTGDPKYNEIVSQVNNEENKTSEEVITKDYGEDLSHGISITTGEDNRTKLSTAQVLIELDRVYAYFIYEDANFYFIDLKKPSEVYEKILVIDAGHGGKDAGALSKGEMFYEKNINLDIVLHLKDLLDKENIKVYYTRTADDKVFLRPRVTLANAVDCDYFISIHCNANEVTSPNGTEVLYYDNEYKDVAAEDLANLFSEELEKTVDLERRGIVQKHLEDIFIMDKSVVPTVLIEVGYLTNNGDMDYLSSSVNRKAVAEGIYNGIMRAYKELPVTKEGQ